MFPLLGLDPAILSPEQGDFQETVIVKKLDHTQQALSNLLGKLLNNWGWQEE